MRLAEQIGRNLKGGEVIELLSDLGGGKTTFVKGLARGMGSTDNVHSPSFTIANIYRSKDLTLHHFDFYRLDNPGIMRDELAEVVGVEANVVAVEWPNVVNDVLPADRITINIVVTTDDKRNFDFKFDQKFDYLIPFQHLTR